VGRDGALRLGLASIMNSTGWTLRGTTSVCLPQETNNGREFPGRCHLVAIVLRVRWTLKDYWQPQGEPETAPPQPPQPPSTTVPPQPLLAGAGETATRWVTVLATILQTGT
jgi:hypothetical protein